MKKWIVSACLLMVQAGAWGKITLPDIVSDNMVLQQQAEACLWGKANAEVYNNLQIKLTCDKVAQPVAVRYCFRDFQPGNVANLRELPLYPFRTDNWE